MEWFFECLIASYKVNKIMGNCIIFLLGGIIGILATLCFTYTTTPEYSVKPDHNSIVIDTPLKYYGSVVIDKYTDTTTFDKPWYQMVIRVQEFGELRWYTKRMNVTEYEYKLYNIGDTVDIHFKTKY